jgi:propionyl-CoA carboxylase beta chain
VLQRSAGEARRERQHQEGKLSARERIELLLDEGTFEELDKLVSTAAAISAWIEQVIPGDGFVTGYGRINGRLVYVFAQDFTVFGGSLSETNAQKICKIMDLALKTGAPVIGLNDSGGARIQEGVVSLAGYADIFLRNTLASGVVPQISAIMGPVRGRRGLLARHHRFRLHGGRHQLHVRHRSRRHQDRHPRRRHQGRAGRLHDAQLRQRRGPFHRADDAECLRMIRELLSYLPQNNREDPPRRATTDPPTAPTPRSTASSRRIQPALRHQGRDHRVVDDGEFFEVHEHWAKNIVVGFARMDGRSSASSPISRRFWPAAWISIHR